MEPYEARPGVVVRVREGHRNSQYVGIVGTIKNTYGDPYYPAVDVLLEDGRLELFWFHQLDKASEEAI